MKICRMLKLSGLLALFSMVVFLGTAVNRAWAVEEVPPKEIITEELPPGEVEARETFWDRWLVIADFSGFYTESDVKNEDTLSGGSIKGLLAPTYRFNDQTFFILMYDGRWYKKLEFYSDDEGGRQREEFQGHTIQPMLRYDFGERLRYSLTPSVFHTATYNKDTDTTGWSDGLYNFRDCGVGLDFDMREVFGENGTFYVGGQYYSREYPNYDSLLSITGLDLVGQPNVERNEKDYHGVLAKTGYDWIQSWGFSFSTEYTFLYKRLNDKRIVNSNGVLTSDKQRDYMHSLDLNSWYMFDIGGGLKVGLDVNGTVNDSNQNYWDEKIPGAGLFDPMKYTQDYYDYTSYRLRPNVSYSFPILPLTASLSYAYYRLEYEEREARYSDGVYKNKDQYEYEQDYELGLKYDLTENWSLLASWEQAVRRSNNDDERNYVYNYTVNYYSIGVHFKY